MQFVSNQNLAHFKEYYFKNMNMIKIVNIFGLMLQISSQREYQVHFKGTVFKCSTHQICIVIVNSLYNGLQVYVLVDGQYFILQRHTEQILGFLRRLACK